MKGLILLLVIIAVTHCEDCSNFNGEYPCQGEQVEYPTSWDTRSFQTPPRNDLDWRKGYQDMHLLVGYVQIKYTQDKKSCTLIFITKVNKKKVSEAAKTVYTFGDKEQESNTISLTSADKYPDGMKLSVKLIQDGKTIATLDLEEVYFMWDAYPVNQPASYENGQKGAIVEMFGWPYDDIAEECEFLGKAGYMAVKVFPPQEAILTFDTVENGELNQWSFMYQPVSYRLHSRMGTKKQLKAMIEKCRSNNVRVYADAVVNHMAGNGNDMYADHRNLAGGSCIHWGPKVGSSGSPWYTTGWVYENNKWTGERPGLEFPSVPYTASDFHCERTLSSWTDPKALNYGWLVGLTDLNTEKESVQQRIADYITDLLSMGISGIRIDAAKHISPTGLSQIFKKLKANLGGGELPDDFTSYLEVLYGGEKDLLMCSDNPYSYGVNLVNLLKKEGMSDKDIEKIKLWGNDYPKEFPICSSWVIPAERNAIGLDCHDDQNPGSSSRDMGDKGSVYIKEKNADRHRHFSVELFSRRDQNWKIKLVMSSYSFMNNGAAGFPDGNSDCSKCSGDQCKKNCNRSVPYQKAYNPSSKGYDTSIGGWKEGSYTRVHRDESIINAMRGWMNLSALSTEELYADEMKKAMNTSKHNLKFFEV